MHKKIIMVNEEQIARFLEGRNQQKYIVAVEIPYGANDVSLIINDPEKGKYIKKDAITSFVWFKEDITKMIYSGKRTDISKACTKFGVTFSKLKSNFNGEPIANRMSDGFKFMAKCKGPYSKLLNFFKQGGVDIYSDKYKSYFIAINPIEQYLISSGKRLFKGMEDYNDLHRLQFDLETTGLNPKGILLSREEILEVKGRMGTNEDLTKIYEFDGNNEPLRYKDARIFQIGVKDNRGFEEIIEIKEGVGVDDREEEIYAIIQFFEYIKKLEPDVIAGYNSENFDWSFIYTRCDILGVDVELIAKTLDKINNSKIKRVDKTLKLGGMSEHYKQTTMWGYNIVDVYHAVRRAKAINSNIKKAGLKYITKFAKLNKPNRVYVEGDKIYSMWADKVTTYAFNDVDGTYYKITEEKPLEEGYELVYGNTIIRRYLLDDLWETEKVDGEFNQASFLLSKIIPTSYMRSTTMGTAGIWKLIMLAWSYENRLTIPDTKPRQTFTGGLSRLLEVGFAKKVAKLDFAALYPNIEITHDIFPDTDITGVMKGMLIYIASTRDKFKGLMNDNKGNVKKLTSFLEQNKGEMDSDKISLFEAQIKESGTLARMYDKKQLPIKILGNSFFGSLGAPNIFPWGDIDCAEETTCRGRQYLRLMVRFFVDKGFRPLVGDSVTFNTPIYIRWKNSREIDILPICDLYNPNSNSIDEEEIRDYEIKPYEVLTVNGWKEINYVYRHETQKQIHRVSTKDKLVCVTEDHSLFQNGIQVKPSSLKRGDLIDVYQLPQYNTDALPDTRVDFYWLLGYFLGDGSAIYGPRKQHYKSRKTGETHINKGVRGEWKISSSNLENLEKLKTILEENWSFWDIKPTIKDHRKSSGVYNLVVYKTDFSQRFCEDFYTSYREKKVPTFVLNATLENKKAFMDGVCASDGYGNDMETVSDIGMKSQVAMSGIGYLLNCLGVQYKIKLRKDKENFISFKLRNRNRNNSEFTDKTIMQSNKVWKNEEILNRDKENYVYDISTEDGTFIGGIGGVNLKNTDGFNFAIPDDIDTNFYTPLGIHRFTEHSKGKLVKGLDAVVDEFNELFMIGRMGLDIDDICETTINFSRKNYANLINGKTKFVGNTIKSSKMPIYIEEFLDEGIKYLLAGDGFSFIQLYNRTVDDIYNFRVPLVKIASKANIKQTKANYIKDNETKTKAGHYKARKAHMELALQNKIKINLGDMMYYVNTGTVKSHGDCKVTTDKETGERTVSLNCMVIPTDQIENNPELTTTEYNVAKYLANFNKRINPLLVCFKTEIRDQILLDMVKNKKTQEMELMDVKVFTKAQCVLDSGNAFKESDQDSLNELMTMEDKEIMFWMRTNKIPNNLEELNMDWDFIQKDYNERKILERANGILEEEVNFKNVIKRLEIEDIIKMREESTIPKALSNIAEFNVHDDKDGNPNIFIRSIKWEVDLGTVNDIFKYEPWAKKRVLWYPTTKFKKNRNYESWLNYIWLEAKRNGEDNKANYIEKELNLAGIELNVENYVEIKNGL